MNYKGYEIKDLSWHYGYQSYSVTGCVWLFDTIAKLEEYIDSHPNIKSSDNGSMIYIPKADMIYID